MTTSTQTRWTDEAVCATTDPELFYPQLGDNTAPARNICAVCPVRRPCLEEALHDEYGINAGLAPEQRHALRHIIGKHPQLREAILNYAATNMQVPNHLATR